jgi:hypothetical protein
MFSPRINFLKGSNRLLTKSKLEKLDTVYNGTPFVNVASKNQDTKSLDIVLKGQPFYGAK